MANKRGKTRTLAPFMAIFSAEPAPLIPETDPAREFGHFLQTTFSRSAELRAVATERARRERLLGPDEYLVQVDYDMPRDKTALEEEFSKNAVSHLFYDDHEWWPHASCAGIDRTPCEQVMLVKHFDRKIAGEEAIAEMGKLGYRPAIHLEMYAFAKSHPDFQPRYSLVALGDSAAHADHHLVAVLSTHAGQRVLGDFWREVEWGSDSLFLFVRNPASD